VLVAVCVLFSTDNVVSSKFLSKLPATDPTALQPWPSMSDLGFIETAVRESVTEDLKVTDTVTAKLVMTNCKDQDAKKKAIHSAHKHVYELLVKAEAFLESAIKCDKQQAIMYDFTEAVAKDVTSFVSKVKAMAVKIRTYMGTNGDYICDTTSQPCKQNHCGFVVQKRKNAMGFDKDHPKVVRICDAFTRMSDNNTPLDELTAKVKGAVATRAHCLLHEYTHLEAFADTDDGDAYGVAKAKEKKGLVWAENYAYTLQLAAFSDIKC